MNDRDASIVRCRTAMRWGLSLYVTLAFLSLVVVADSQTIQEYRITEAEKAVIALQLAVKEIQNTQWKLVGLLIGNLMTGLVLLAVHVLTHRRDK